jgi:hypothetical protein
MENRMEDAFDLEMRRIYERARDEIDYRASRFLEMVEQQGGLATAKSLLRGNQVSDGFAKLWEKSRLDLTVEHLVLEEPWRALFTPEEIAEAARRLGRDA